MSIQVLGLGLLALAALNARAEKYVFQTAFDQFEFSATGSRAQFEGKTVDISPFSEALTKLGEPLAANCPALSGKPDFTITIGAQPPRQIYAKIGIVTDGKTCTYVGGDGLSFLPNTREFLNGHTHDSIHLQSPAKLTRGETTVFSGKKVNGHWESQNPTELIDEDAMEKFENSLADFNVRLRVQETVTKDKTKFVLNSGGQTYELYKLTNLMWALKKPGSHLLLASDDWSRWYDLDPKMFRDRYAAQIELIGGAGHSSEEKVAALNKLESSWSSNLRALYHKLVLDPAEDQAVQEIAMRRLKRKPSTETAGVMIQVIQGAGRPELKTLAAAILRIQDPKGPRYNPHGSEADTRKFLEFWKAWLSKNQRRL